MRDRTVLLSRRRRHRLPNDSHPVGHPVHVTIRTRGGEPVFAEPRIAAPLFALVADHSQTLACCLMPDHLHWLLNDARSMGELVRSFKSYSTYAVRTLGHGPKLWQRSFSNHVLGKEENLRQVAEHIVQTPVRSGIVQDFRQYPFQQMKL